MKLALTMTDSGSQITLTPETPQEKAILALIHATPQTIALKTGPVIARTTGGFYREFDERPNTISTIIVITPGEPKSTLSADSGKAGAE